jgi:hypothetical protein
MGGGLLQLVAYGAQDIYLTGNPQITFFKVVYRRHTNFALEAIENVFNGNPRFGSRVTCQISRNGDLIHRTYLSVNLPALKSGLSWVRHVGLKLVQDVWIEIGGQQIDKHYSDWMYIWNELSLPVGKKSGYDAMVGNGYQSADLSTSSSTPGAGLGPSGSASAVWVHVPLEFWFCRNVGLALPLIALQYHEVKIKIDFETKANCAFVAVNDATTNEALADPANVPNITDMSLWVDYIFLDTDERRRFAQLSHEYLIEQLQFTGTETLNNNANNRIKLNFNHPCKELVWVAKPKFDKKASWYNYTNTDHVDLTKIALTEVKPRYGTGAANVSSNYITDFTTSNYMFGYDFATAGTPSLNASTPFADAILQLNGNDRFSVRDGAYFSYVQPYQHHTNIPSNPGISVYSFALKPEDHQPSGTLNMSRIDTATLMITTKNVSKYTTGATTFDGINIYAVNYNVLRILSGMGGLAYSN